MKNKLHQISKKIIFAFITVLAMTFSMNAQTIIDRVPDNETGLISTKGNDNTGVYSADYFELTAPLDIGDIRFYGFSTSAGFLPNLTGFNIIIFEHTGTIPDGHPETVGSGFVELKDIAPADFDYVSGIFTVNATQANGGVTVTLPAGEYWIAAYPSVSSPPMTIRWNWQGSLSASPTYSSVLIDPSDLFSAGATTWMSISTLIAPDPFPSFAWTMTEDGVSLPASPCLASIIDVEPITKVVFADIDNSSSAASTDEIEDFTLIEGQVEQGEPYDIELEGFTNGNYENYFTVWIDWNQDGNWESTVDEMYEVGSIINSTGLDGIKATATINVPLNAALGSTSMRIVKNYGESPTDPCGTYGYGQIEDYTIVVVAPASNTCDVVTNIAVTNIAATNATIGWDAVASATDGYIIEVYEAGADPSVSTPVFNDVVGVGIITIQATGLNPETDYDVYVISDCGSVEATSAAVTFTTGVLACDVVTNIAVTNIAATNATISWDAVASATDGYIIEVYEAGANPSVDSPIFNDVVGVGITTIQATGLNPETDYDVYVISDCGSDEVTSAAVTFTTGVLACDVVTNIAVTNIAATNATISWDAVASATDGYIIEVYEAGANPSVDSPIFNDVVGVGITTIQATGLNPETDYDVYVISDCGSDEATSAAVTFTTGVLACDVVTNVVMSAITETTATVTWTASATATVGYIVDVYTAGADITTATPIFSETVNSTTTSVIATSLTASTDYDVYVTSDCGFGETTITGAVSFTTDATSSLDGFEILNLSIYPNPANSDLNISAAKVIEDIKIYNILNQLVLTANPNNLDVILDVGYLNAGTYILKVTAEGMTNVVRFIKN